MLKPIAFANAITSVFFVAYTACALIAFITPDLYFGILSNMFHSFNLEAVKATEPISLGGFALGLVTFSAYVWVFTFSSASLYNKFAK